eukprot:364749-Chlamydomonas_euryale.AAC.9
MSGLSVPASSMNVRIVRCPVSLLVRMTERPVVLQGREVGRVWTVWTVAGMSCATCMSAACTATRAHAARRTDHESMRAPHSLCPCMVVQSHLALV